MGELKPRARVFRQANGGIAVVIRYRGGRFGRAAHCLTRGESLHGVPFEQWAAHVGRTIELFRWEGTAAGMIGGSERYQVEAFFYCESPFDNPLSDPDEVRAELRRLETELSDPEVEYLPQAHNQMRQIIACGREWLDRQAHGKFSPA